MSVQSGILTTTGDLSTYDVRTITANETADNQSYVSSLTGGNTYRVIGNMDKTWDISLYLANGTYEIPAALTPGQTITCTLPTGGTSQLMMIDSAALEVDIESGALLGLSLTCSATTAASYA